MSEPTKADPILVEEYEGTYVRDFEAKLPGITIQMPEGYKHGAHLKLMVEVRVRGVSHDEKKAGGDTVIVRQHKLALENIELVGAYTADSMDVGVGGTASAAFDDPDQLALDEALERAAEAPEDWIEGSREDVLQKMSELGAEPTVGPQLVDIPTVDF